MQKKINAIKTGTNSRRINAKLVEELSESIKNVGLINPITITSSNQLIAGLHRLEACKQLGYNEIECTVINKETPLEIELIQIDENIIRNHLTVLEQGDLLVMRKNIYETLYPETKHGANQFSRGKTDSGYPNNPECFVSNTSKLTNKSESTIKTEIQISENIIPTVKEIIMGTELATQKTNLLELSKLPKEKQIEVAEQLQLEPNKSVKETIKNLRNKEKIEFRKKEIRKIRDNILSISKTQIVNKFDIINMDAPWPYENNGGSSCDDYNPQNRRCTTPYPSMTICEIMDIKLPASDNCVLLFWTTQKYLPFSFEIVKNMGFEYKYYT